MKGVNYSEMSQFKTNYALISQCILKLKPNKDDGKLVIKVSILTIS